MKKLLPGEKFTNDQVSEIFHCSTQGGMRRALKTNTLVLISNKIKSIYQDRMIGNNIYYTVAIEKCIFLIWNQIRRFY